MARTKAEQREYMRGYMARKRANTEAVSPEAPVVSSPTEVPVSPVSTPVNPPVSTRQALRDRLAALEAQYRVAQRAQDWPACRRVNDEREPLFGELWELERELPESERYWFPARIINQGEGFAVGRVR